MDLVAQGISYHAEQLLLTGTVNSVPRTWIWLDMCPLLDLAGAIEVSTSGAMCWEYKDGEMVKYVFTPKRTMVMYAGVGLDTEGDRRWVAEMREKMGWVGD